ncbi:MAG: DUF3365 domain-containing protein [Bdellovibrionaceae bacterium]|nr:DUF3365 domain-containing protein [Pseudobdellovibrionaceae bacterium]MDW8189916.1 DUF3365 domain-containing protein [Pseudobdellovibrionaceae bacterium]
MKLIKVLNHMKLIKRLNIVTLLSFIFTMIGSIPLLAQPKWEQNLEQEIINKLKELTELRQNLANTIVNKRADEIDETIFKNVCAPVGVALQNWANEKGFEAFQKSHKARNPQNVLPSQYQKFLSQFQNKAKRPTHITQHAHTESGNTVLEIIYPIYVVSSCLKCHGKAEDRPAFIKSKYPNDLAYNFRDGDLRGFFLIRAPLTNKANP